MSEAKAPVSRLRAIALALTGFSLWVGSDTCAKLAIKLGVPKHEVLAIVSFASFMTVFLVVLLRRDIGKLRAKNYRGLAALGVMCLVNYGFFIVALAHLPLANFYTVIFLAPSLVAIFAALVLREHLSWRMMAAIAAGFIGVIIAVDPTHLSDASGDWLGYGAAFIGMTVLVAQQVMMRFLGDQESHEATAFYSRIGLLTGGAGSLFILGFQPIALSGLLFALASGCIGGMGWLCMARAYKHAPAAIIAPFHYSQIVTGTIMGYLLWQDVPNGYTLTGAAIIVASGIYIARHVQKSAQLPKEESHV